MREDLERMKGIKLEVTGDANDYVGKGLSGAKIIIKPNQTKPNQTNHLSLIVFYDCLYNV